MIDTIQRIQDEVGGEFERAVDLDALEKLRVHYLGKKGVITSLMQQLKDLDPARRKDVGATLNQLKDLVESRVESRKGDLGRLDLERELAHAPKLDVTLPGQFPLSLGSAHPIHQILDSMVDAMSRIGYSVAHGPEIETEFYNFEALNTPSDHPARDVQDTFYLRPGVLLRSHTSPVQIRTMKERLPPLQIISVGKVYRSDSDLTHTPMFHQMEGLFVDQTASLADLKGTLQYLIKQVFGSSSLRFRPSFFPFTEPSAEIDMRCFGCKGDRPDCRLCRGSGWIEIGGCGMVHPNVFKAVGYDSDRFSGFAFGMGIERIAMLKYGIDDLRSLFENDCRMLEQF